MIIENKNHYRVTALSWERIFFHFSIQADSFCPTEFLLARLDEENLGKTHDIRKNTFPESVPILPVKADTDGAAWQFCLNYAAVKGRSFLGNGKWILLARTKEGQIPVDVTFDAADTFDAASRVFRYGNARYALTVNFSVCAVEDRELVFVLENRFMAQNRSWKKRHYIKEPVTLKGKCRRVGTRSFMIFLQIFYRIAEKLRPKDGRNILLMSETHDYLWGNLKAIDEELKKQGLDRKYRITCSFRKAVGWQKLSAVGSWFATVWKLAGQDYVFVDDYVPILGFLDLGKRTKLIQVWHAGEGFKSVGYSRFGKDGSPYPAVSCHRKYDYVLTGAERLVDVFAEVFGIEREAFLPVGMPRLDGFLDPGRISRFKEGFYRDNPGLKEKKLILFAPTYRGTGQDTAYYDYSWLNLKEIYDFCGEDRRFLVKMHPFVKEKIRIPEEYRDRILEFSDFPDINSLYYVTDLLITDYSSNYYEYALLRRPVLFFTPDRRLYEISRGVHRRVKECAPGKVCDTFEQMMEALRKGDFEQEKIERFAEENFADYDGHAAERALRAVLSPGK